jgi:hypothetical protein
MTPRCTVGLGQAIATKAEGRMGIRRLTRNEAAFVIGVPIAWAILLLFHPGGEGDAIYAEIHDETTEMLVVHIGMLIFLPLFAIGIYLLLRGIESTAATVARWALIPYVVFYAAWESLQGIANAVLVDQANGLPEADRGVAAQLIQDFAESPLVTDFGVFAIIGSVALLTAAIATGLALRDAGGLAWAPAVFGVAGFLISAHPPPFGPIGLLLFVVGVIGVMRSRPEPEPLRPRPT